MGTHKTSSHPLTSQIFILIIFGAIIIPLIGFITNLYIGDLNKLDKNKTVHPPKPTQIVFPTINNQDNIRDEKVYCKASRPKFCTEECLLPPPYLCGSNGKSYCTKCQACADKNVEWYQFQDEPCTDTSSSPHPMGDAASKKECLEKGGKWQQWGLIPQEYCQIPSQDAGKPCTDGSQCEYGLCMSREQSTQGVCSTYSQEFGCYSTIVNGQPGSAICVD